MDLPQETTESIPTYADLLDSMKEINSTLEEMQDQVFKMQLEMADVMMQTACIYDPDVTGYVLKTKENPQKIVDKTGCNEMEIST